MNFEGMMLRWESRRYEPAYSGWSAVGAQPRSGGDTGIGDKSGLRDRQFMLGEGTGGI